MSDLLSLPGSGSGAALLGGTLRLKYQTHPFACKRPTWKVPLHGGVANILCDVGNKIGHGGVASIRGGRGGFLGKSCKRVRLTKKTRVSGSERPIPGGFTGDPGIHENPDIGRSVVRRLSGCSSPGGRLDQTGIG